MDAIAPLLKRLDRIAKRRGLTDARISRDISGKKANYIVARLRRGEATLKTLQRVQEWVAREERA